LFRSSPGTIGSGPSPWSEEVNSESHEVHYEKPLPVDDVAGGIKCEPESIPQVHVGPNVEVVFPEQFQRVPVEMVNVSLVFDVTKDRHIVADDQFVSGLLCSPRQFGISALAIMLVVVKSQLPEYLGWNKHTSASEVRRLVRIIASSK